MCGRVGVWACPDSHTPVLPYPHTPTPPYPHTSGISAQFGWRWLSSSEGAVAIADSEYSNNFANVAIDGKWLGPGDPLESNRWHSSLAKPHPHWVWIRFRLPAVISKVVIHRADIVGHPVDFVGEYSPDGGLTFRTLFSVKGCRMTPETWTIERTFPEVTTDNFRLRITRSSNERNPDYAQVSEIEVFGEHPTVMVGPPVYIALLPAEVMAPSDSAGLTVKETTNEIEFRSGFLRVALSKSEPRISALCWDSLGEGKLGENLLKPDGATPSRSGVFPDPDAASSTVYTREGNVIRYETIHPDDVRSRWQIRVEEKSIWMSLASAVPVGRVARTPSGIRFAFACEKTPVAPISNPSKDSSCPLPCLLHAPDFGTLLVEGNGRLIGESVRPQARWNASVVAASRPRTDGLYVLPAGASSLELRFSVRSDTIPAAKLLGKDARLCAMPRHWLNGFQYRPDFGILSNNIVSDNCCFCMHQYADLAVFSADL
ncbi:MAG: hypothetical protein NTU88_10425, partial [Armatimonadetes bacterium]|nr:hypothetical protein [Armatimonadota bacterium]